MFSFFCRNVLKHRVTSLSLDVVVGRRVVVQNIPSFHLRFVSQIPETANSQASTVDFLITKCGLSPKKAISVSKSNRVDLSSTENPNLVLGILENNGFTKTQITNIISKYPSLLLLDPDDNLKPKFDYLKLLGFFGPDLGKLIQYDPDILKASLKDQIIPSIDFLKDFLPSDNDVLSAVKHAPMLLRLNLEKLVGSNIATLQNISVPKSNISKLLVTHPRVLMTKAERFIGIVEEIKQKGFNPSSTMFIRAVEVLACLSTQSFEGRLTVYREFGFSEVDILSLFRKQPMSMGSSEEKLRKGLHFFMKQLKWDSTYLSKYSVVLRYSMEKRIIPRCAVLEILILKGVLKRSAIVGKVFNLTEKEFMGKFVIKYKKSVPQVVKTYEDLIRFAGNVSSERNDSQLMPLMPE